jgi:zinc protease
VSAHELDTAKRQIEVAMVYELTTNAAIADRIGYDVATFGTIRPLEERLAAIEAVAAADVQRVARTYLTESARNVVRVVPRPGAAPAQPSVPGAGGR